VLCAERWVLAPLRHRRFFSLAELNKAIWEQLDKLNNRAFRGEPTSRRELFEELDRPALKPLPATAYEFGEWRKVTVNIDYHVQGPDRKFYSVPYRLVRKKLDLRATSTTIEIFKSNQRVASHVRERGRRRYITDPAHMPESHRSYLDRRRTVSSPGRPPPAPKWQSSSTRCSPRDRTPSTPTDRASGCRASGAATATSASGPRPPGLSSRAPSATRR
jgi:hypothetical protein